MLVNFNMIFDEVQGANHSHSRSYEEDLQRRNSQKDIKIIDNLSVVRVLVHQKINLWYHGIGFLSTGSRQAFST